LSKKCELASSTKTTKANQPGQSGHAIYRVLEEYRVKTVSHTNKGDMCANQLNNSERNYCGKIFGTGWERKKGEITTTADVAELPDPRPPKALMRP
jgi:hypothetical protein